MSIRTTETARAPVREEDVPGTSERGGPTGRPPEAGGTGTLTRRNMLATAGATLTGGALLLSGSAARAQPEVPAARGPREGSAASTGPRQARQDWLRPGMPGRDYPPVVVPNGSKLPWKVVDGVKVFHLVAEEVEHEFAPGLKAFCWGYNGRVHGPTIEAVEGDRVRIYVTNRLPAPTTVHWHGILLPNGMDGVGGLNQKSIAPGETFQYEFTLRQSGTNMYHSHHDEMTQIALGLTGMFIIHPRRPRGPRIDRDFVILLHEWRIDVGTRRPHPNEMTDFNVLTMNAKAFPGTEPLVVRQGERVRIRLGNLSPQNHHPIHLHGFHFRITETDGGRVPESAQQPETTVIVPVGSARAIEFVADAPGDWALHCHMTHHLMNQMGHAFPNMIGVKPGGLDAKVRALLPGYMTMGQTGMAQMGEMGMPVPPNSIPMLGLQGKHDSITMGGMFTVLKVRERLDGYKDPGWYDNPPGTLAEAAITDALRRDGIDVDAPAPVEPGSPA
ncbi:multicopper oxidase domain-containing protein [Corallococcus carmarthensis]|uniref:Copper oxidase n=2 Tax=Corallococcus carmarthensis TaxID=2316728 RepID=A0A3A8KJ21_9BACT|nr:multicopper oxidase domain-containing protein [Corallococcus carmarthensis]RKH07109.1 copper oxidase [Corallococcus carmarthensis]